MSAKQFSFLSAEEISNYFLIEVGFDETELKVLSQGFL